MRRLLFLVLVSGGLQTFAGAQPLPAPTPLSIAQSTPCGLVIALNEDFDGVTAPALPSDWISSFTPGSANCMPTGTCSLGTDWITSTTNPFTPPNCAFHDAPDCVTDSTLETPTFSCGPTNGVRLFFRHSFDLENARDGAVLEISINGGPFVDFVAAGGGNLFYNGTISSGFLSPIAGRSAWTGNSGGYWDTIVQFPPSALFQNVRLRFRLATDCSGSGTGWRIDNIRVEDNIGCPSPTPSPPSPTPTATSTATATATVTATATATATVTPVVTPCPGQPGLFENFDEVTAPALPAGWFATNAIGAGPLWVTSTTQPLSLPNDAFVDDPATMSDKSLDTPNTPIGGGNPQVSFFHFYNLESGLDGGVLEVSSPNINGGTFTDITDPAVGGSFVSGGYNTTISTAFMSPIAGRMAWSGNSGGYIGTVARLGTNVIGHYIKVRFRMASDNSGSSTGWRIDNVGASVDCHSPTPSPPPSSPTPTATATATAQPTPSEAPHTISGTISYCSDPVRGPVPNVLLTLTGSTSASTLSDSSGNYIFSGLALGTNYTVTPSKTARTPGSAGITTIDTIAVQRHFLFIGTPLSGCRLTAADCAAPPGITTGDVIATQRFFLGFTTGIGNVGKYQFNPTNRTYTPFIFMQTNQNYDALVFGDVSPPFVE